MMCMQKPEYTIGPALRWKSIGLNGLSSIVEKLLCTRCPCVAFFVEQHPILGGTNHPKSTVMHENHIVFTHLSLDDPIRESM